MKGGEYMMNKRSYNGNKAMVHMLLTHDSVILASKVAVPRYISKRNVAYVVHTGKGFVVRFYSSKRKSYLDTIPTNKTKAQDTCKMLRRFWDTNKQDYQFPSNLNTEVK